MFHIHVKLEKKKKGRKSPFIAQDKTKRKKRQKDKKKV